MPCLCCVPTDDLWPESERKGNEDPDWIKSEKEQFLKFRDRDGNGKLDIEEIGNWVMPPDYDHARAEANHLIHHADKNKVPKHTVCSSATCESSYVCLMQGFRVI